MLRATQEGWRGSRSLTFPPPRGACNLEAEATISTPYHPNGPRSNWRWQWLLGGGWGWSGRVQAQPQSPSHGHLADPFAGTTSPGPTLGLSSAIRLDPMSGGSGCAGSGSIPTSSTQDYITGRKTLHSSALERHERVHEPEGVLVFTCEMLNICFCLSAALDWLPACKTKHTT